MMTRARSAVSSRRARLAGASPRERYAIGVAIGIAAFLVGVAQVWPPGAWMLGGLAVTGLSLVGLAGRSGR